MAFRSLWTGACNHFGKGRWMPQWGESSAIAEKITSMRDEHVMREDDSRSLRAECCASISGGSRLVAERRRPRCQSDGATRRVSVSIATAATSTLAAASGRAGSRMLPTSPFVSARSSLDVFLVGFLDRLACRMVAAGGHAGDGHARRGRHVVRGRRLACGAGGLRRRPRGGVVPLHADDGWLRTRRHPDGTV